MFIGYAQNVKFDYTRVGGKPLGKEPVYNEDGSVEWKWASFHEDSLEIRCELENEAYIGAVTIPTTDGSKCARVRAYVDGKMVGVYTAETGKTIGGKITVNGGTAMTISTTSANGAYTPVEIDTSTNKTVTISTVTGALRAMIDAIEFKN